MKYFVVCICILLLAFPVSAQRRHRGASKAKVKSAVMRREMHRFFPDGYDFGVVGDEKKVYLIERKFSDEAHVLIYLNGVVLRMVEVTRDNTEQLCPVLEGGNEECAFGTGIYIQMITYKTSFGYCLIGVGFAGVRERSLMFCIPSKCKPIIHYNSDNSINIAWIDDFETQYSGPAVIDDGFFWNARANIFTRISYPTCNTLEYDNLKGDCLPEK